MSGERTLYVLRHAKSSWDDASVADHDRPLSGRGQRAAKLLSRYVAERQIRPQLILCSTAARTQATMRSVFPQPDAEGWRYPYGQAQVEHVLYGASADALLIRLQQLDPELASVMVIGHNPALQMLTLRLAGSESPDRDHGAEGLEEIRNKLPTGALATLSFPGPWSALGHHVAQLTDYVRPKALNYT